MNDERTSRRSAEAGGVAVFRRHFYRHSWLAGALIVAALAAGCAGADDTGEVSEEETSPPPGDPNIDEESTVIVVESALGPVLADAEGKTLYLFAEDPPGQSTCIQYCVETWPPMVADGTPVAGRGVDATLLEVIDRDDGSSQVTYADHPLYYFAGDDGAMDGHGLNGSWFAVHPSGAAISAGASG
jgi:predicted lipoprotein with Yx(FWY)xxD motif